MTDFYKFSSIKAFQHRVKQGGRNFHEWQYSLIFPKLHGTNAAIGVFENGVTVQSRNRLLSAILTTAGSTYLLTACAFVLALKVHSA